MRDWNNIVDRRAATLDFRDFMETPGNEAIRQDCCNNPTVAKQQFALRGGIEIPTAVEFRVYRTTDAARHNLAVLILPSSTGGVTSEPANILIAAWPAWGTRPQQIAALVKQLGFLSEELAAEERSQDGPG
jgi:hypothetical protein